MEKEDETN